MIHGTPTVEPVTVVVPNTAPECCKPLSARPGYCLDAQHRSLRPAATQYIVMHAPVVSQ